MCSIENRFIIGPEKFRLASLHVHFLALKHLPAGAVKGFSKRSHPTPGLILCLFVVVVVVVVVFFWGGVCGLMI